jgi:hypothetical protein
VEEVRREYPLVQKSALRNSTKFTTSHKKKELIENAITELYLLIQKHLAWYE